MKDDAPIFGFAAVDVDRNSTLYPTLTTDMVINYDVTKPIYFLSDVYLRDDRQIKNISVVVTNLSTTDWLEWNKTIPEVNYTNTTNGTTAIYTFMAITFDEWEWEMFLMSFSFLQSAMRAVDRSPSNRTISVITQDCTNSVTLTVVINVLPLPPDVIITLQNITFTEGDNFILLRNAFPIAVLQDEDALFVSLTITLQ